MNMKERLCVAKRKEKAKKILQQGSLPLPVSSQTKLRISTIFDAELH